MEQGIFRKWENNRGIELNKKKVEKLIAYAQLIHETNSKFNLTGFKTLEEIISNLIIGSIDPLAFLNVPRGTLFADIGTGAGIPGIPLAVYNDNWMGVCVDSNSKKISFVDSVIRKCGIDNLRSYNGRLESIAGTHLKENFDYVFSRALGELFFVVEVGAPLLKIGGMLYVYSHATPEELPPAVIEHAKEMGLVLLEQNTHREFGIEETGLVFIKKNITDRIYPRKMTVIKRDIMKKIKGS